MHFFIPNRLYWLSTLLILCFVTGYFVPVVYAIAQPLALLLGLAVAVDSGLLFFTRGTVTAIRECRERLSNGDENEVKILLQNKFLFRVTCKVLDELPFQFQMRIFNLELPLIARQLETITYTVKPVKRGVYNFGNINVLVKSRLGLIRRRIVVKATCTVNVYPSFVKLHQYELLAISSQLRMQGQKRVRKVGNSHEFDTIRDYVGGDDPRHINWSATARRGHLMTNHFIDERSQNVYCIIDKSRSMKMPFEGMTLLDYAVNAALVMADISLKKGDRAGLMTFENTIDAFVKAGNRNAQIHQLMETLYHQDTSFEEPDIAAVYNFVKKNINQRSLLIFFTNFESIHSLERQLKYLQLVNREHLLLVVYFRNTEVDRMLFKKASGTREIYDQTIAYQMLQEKKRIGEALNRAGILSLYTAPKNLNVDIINKYLEVKTKRML